MKIARLVVLKKHSDCKRRERLIKSFVAWCNRKGESFDFLVSPGGFLEFDFPSKYNSIKLKDIQDNSQFVVRALQIAAAEKINAFMTTIKKELSAVVRYFTIGIDSINSKKTIIELVAVYDLKEDKIVHWTGKSYPTEEQMNKLITVDIKSHIFRTQQDTVLMLGCHDLNIFSPRGNVTMKQGSKRYNLNKAYMSEIENAGKISAVLHHPHRTNSPSVWQNSWKVCNEKLQAEAYVSGIYFEKTCSEENLKVLKKVLNKTKYGNVSDYESMEGF